MKVTRIRALRGPNLWTRHTALEAIVECSPEECTTSWFLDFERRLRERFPELGNVISRDDRTPLSAAHALESALLGLQVQAGCPVTFSRTTPTPQTGIYQVAVAYTEEDVGRRALVLAEQLCDAATHNGPFDLAAALAELRELDEDIRIGPSTGAIVDAAVARGIPYRRLTQGSLIQFGWGSRQRRIQAAETDTTSAIAESIAQDKELTKTLLEAAGVPVPTGRPVSDADDAWAAACEIGLPVVVKPQDGNQGKGVTVNLSDKAQIMAAFHTAHQFRDDVMVEKFLPGTDFRLLVVGDKLVAAARREPPLVIGDGVHTVSELVALVNQDPRRGSGHATSLTRIRIDDIARQRLTDQQLDESSVPAKGRRVILRNNANLSTGGTATDVTDDVHAEVAARAIEAAQMVGLEICGVDVVCESVFRPLEEQSGGIVEVNAAPGLRMHTSPSFGKGRPVGQAIIDAMFEPGNDGRIPIVTVTGTNGKTTTVRLTAHLLKQTGQRVGFTNTDGVYINDQQIDSGDCSGPRSARSVLMHPEVDAAVLETARGGLLREGLAFDRCQVAVVTNLGGGDHLGLNYITTVEDLAVLKRVVVLNVAPHGTAVLNAADPAVAAMAPHCPGDVTFFALDAHQPVMAAHRAKGKRVLFVNEDHIVAQQSSFQIHIALNHVPLTLDGACRFQIENAMAAIGAAWALNTPWEHITQGLASFTSDDQTVPGRFNVFKYRDATIIADYGHNPDAVQALSNTVLAMPARRRIAVISGAGDRRDQDIRDQTRILGGVFDSVVLYQDACQRGRADGEVLQLLREGLEGASATTEVCDIQGEFNAIDTCLAALQPNDLALILIDQVEDALAHIRKRVAELDAPAAVATHLLTAEQASRPG